MIDAGLPVAIASDFNPGSSPSGNMQFIFSMAVFFTGLLLKKLSMPSRSIQPYAMGVEEELGSIAIGKKRMCLSQKKFLPLSLCLMLLEVIKWKL